MMTPHAIIKCPQCSGAAKFAFVTYAQIQKIDIPYFKNSRNFELLRTQDYSGGYFTAALFFPGLSDALENINDLPPRYETRQWETSRYARFLPKEIRNKGSIRCTECLIQKKHELNWPEEAYFQIDYKGQILWAYDRPTALKLLAYLESNERKKAVEYCVGNPWYRFTTEDWFLRHIPTHFKTAKARPEIVKKLRNLLGLPPSTRN